MLLLALLIACSSGPPDASACAPVDEQCNGVDDDCDGGVDEDVASAPTWYADADEDGWGDDAGGAAACAAPPGHVEVSGDCDDSATDVHPGAAEACDGIDQDCDAAIDEDAGCVPGPCDTLIVATDPVDFEGVLGEEDMAAFCEQFNAITGDLTVEATGATDLSALGCLCEVGGNVRVYSNGALASLAGLDRLQTVGGVIYLYDNDALTSLEGLSSLSSLRGLSLSSNDALADLRGFPPLASLESLAIWSGASLTSLAGLETLQSVGELTIQDTPLETLTGLEGLVRVEDALTLSANPRLTDPSALAALRQVVGTLEILDLPITSLDGFSRLAQLGGLHLAGNDALADLGALYRITEIAGSLHIEDSLSLRDLRGLDALTTVGTDVRLEDSEDSASPLESLEALSALTNVGRNLVIAQYANLVDLRGLDNVGGAGGYLHVLYLDNVTTLDGLDAFRFTGARLVVRGNAVLVDVTGLHDVESVGTDLIVAANPSLASADAQALVEAIGESSVGGRVTVEDNGP